MQPRKHHLLPLERVGRAVAAALLDGRLTVVGLEYGLNREDGERSPSEPIKLTMHGHPLHIQEVLDA